MSVYLLPNTVGDVATSITMEAGTTNSGGYTLNDLISGPRSSFWRGTASTSAITPAYVLGADQSITHMVVCRADWMITQGGARIRPRQRSSGGVWSYISGVDYNTLNSSHLLGPKAQDLVFAVSPTNLRGYGLEFDSASVTAEGMQISKLYCSNAFQFDGILSLNPTPQWQYIPQSQSVNVFTPLKAFSPFEVEAKITLNWTGCTRSNIQSFKALPQLLNWPLFIYDDAGDLWNWKLEHVVIESWTEEIVAKDVHDISITFQRLKLYE